MTRHRDPAEVNLAVFDAPEVAAPFAQPQGDGGEQVALLSIAAAVRGRPILDIGVGAGRTTWFLLLLSEDYVGIDISATMLRLCRERFPGVDLRVGDARDLQAFADGSVALATFSNNGIDAVGHADRARVLAEMARVTAEDGYVVYSTHNLRGGSYGEKPWRTRRPYPDAPRSWRRSARAVLQVAEHPGPFGRECRAWWQGARRAEQHPAWAMGPLRAHGFQLFIHFVDVRGLVAELAAADLEPVAVCTLEGQPVDLDGPEAPTHYFHVVARHRRAQDDGAARSGG